MTLSRQTARIYMDEYDLRGVLTVLSDTILADETNIWEAVFLTGAFTALAIIFEQEEIRDQSIFMKLLKNRFSYLLSLKEEVQKEEETCEN